MADNYFAVLVRRKGLADTMQLNFDTRVAAEEAFHNLARLSTQSHAGGVIISDSFGKTLGVTHDEIGPVMLVDVERNVEYQSQEQLLVARANANLQRRAQADPALATRIVMPGNQIAQ